MPGQKLPSEPDLNAINEELTAGLTTCRSVIANYKSLLTDDKAESPDAEEAPVEDGPPMVEGQGQPQV